MLILIVCSALLVDGDGVKLDSDELVIAWEFSDKERVAEYNRLSVEVKNAKVPADSSPREIREYNQHLTELKKRLTALKDARKFMPSTFDGFKIGAVGRLFYSGEFTPEVILSPTEVVGEAVGMRPTIITRRGKPAIGPSDDYRFKVALRGVPTARMKPGEKTTVPHLFVVRDVPTADKPAIFERVDESQFKTRPNKR